MNERQVSIAFQTDKSPSEYVALAKLVNEYDFDVVSVYCDAPYHPSYGPLMLMAPHVKKAKLGPAAVSPFRIQPIDIAANTALLAQIARGGVYIGLARGAWLADHGIQEAERPITAMREAIEVVRLLLSGQGGGYEGQVYSIAEHVRAPYTLPEEEVPVMVGTWGPKLAGLAGELADEVKVGGTANPGFVQLIRRWITKGEECAGRDAQSVGIVIGGVTVIDEDRILARKAARQAAALYLPVVAPLDPSLDIEADLLERMKRLVKEGNTEGAGGLVSDEILERFAFAGDENDLIRQAEAVFDAGASSVEFGTPHGLEPKKGIRIIGERVLPALR